MKTCIGCGAEWDVIIRYGRCRACRDRRDRIASEQMAALVIADQIRLTMPTTIGPGGAKDYASEAVQYADALIAELNKVEK